MVTLVKNIIGVFIGILIGVAFISPIAIATYNASQDGNLSSTAQTLVTLIATLFVVAIMMIAVNAI